MSSPRGTKRLLMRRIVLSIALAALAAVALPAQQPAQPPAQQPPQPSGQIPQATFRASTRLIVHSVTVKDKDGKPVEGLTAKDFVITENNEPQEVAFAVYQRLEGDAGTAPVAADRPPTVAARPATGAPAAVQTQIATPPPGDIRYQNRRLLVLYFDMSSLGQAEQIRALTNAQKYIDTQMRPSDVIAVMAYQGGAVRVKQDFTDDKAALREVIVTLLYGNDLDNDGIPDTPDGGTPFGQDDGEFNIFNTDRRLAALQTAVTMLRALPEQKVLLYFTTGLRLTGTDNQAQLRATTNAAQRANVTINPIDSRGLVAMAPLGDATRASPGGGAIFGSSMAMSMITGFQQSQDTLYALAKDTGGKP